MPSLSLVVCLYAECDLLDRLLLEMAGRYDDLVVVHDGPEKPGGGVAELVAAHGGRFFVGQRAFQQEPHWPRAWREARHDWILRLDADEVPGAEMKAWLQAFRNSPEPDPTLSGYTCIWPLWDGREIVTKKWPAGRHFLFHKQRVRFFGMVEQVPVEDFRYEPLPLILEHRPKRKSYGLRNLLTRGQAYHWRRVIAQSLLGKPTELACWRWDSDQWPPIWEQIRSRPIRTALYRLLVWPLFALRDIWRTERRVIPEAAVCGGIHHGLIALGYWRLRRTRRNS